jgi:hypothetical protein
MPDPEAQADVVTESEAATNTAATSGVSFGNRLI